MTALAYRQEIEAEDLDAMPGALWTPELIDSLRVAEAPRLTRVVVGVDPSGAADGNACGIVAAGCGPCNCLGYPETHGFILADGTIQASPGVWAAAAVALYQRLKADALVAEANFGGEIRIHAAPSFDAAGWSVAFNATQAALLQYRPKVDFGLTPESTKDIPVGTVEALERQGSVPIADFNKRLGQAISKFAGVLSDYVHATYTPQRISRLNMEGVEIAARMWGRDLPNYDFVIEINPPFSGLDKARAGAFDAMFEQVLKAQKLGLPVEEMLDLWASVNNVPRSIVRRFSMAIMRAKERAEELADEEALDAEAAEVPPESAEIGGFNGAGVVPEPEAIGR